jgi:hypothetical protein
MGLCEGFFWGIGGGILAELLGLFKLRHALPGTLPIWLKSPFYWVVTALDDCGRRGSRHCLFEIRDIPTSCCGGKPGRICPFNYRLARCANSGCYSWEIRLTG